jgi:putative ABC transport system permease protein
VQPQPWLYLPHRQHVRDYLGANAYAHLAKKLIIRTAGDPLAMTNVMRRIVGEVDRTQVVNKIQSMEQIMAERVSPWRFLMEIFGILAGIALTLAAVGIFGVMSYTVSRRTHEIGVRMALGAGAGDVLGLMMKHGLRVTVPGIVLGLAGSFGLTRLIGSMLFGVPPNDPVTLSIVSLLLMGIALAACYFPVRRAMSVDPVRALRNE